MTRIQESVKMLETIARLYGKKRMSTSRLCAMLGSHVVRRFQEIKDAPMFDLVRLSTGTDFDAFLARTEIERRSK